MAAHAASRHPRDLTDQQWDLIGRFLPELPRRHDGRGLPIADNVWSAVFDLKERLPADATLGSGRETD